MSVEKTGRDILWDLRMAEVAKALEGNNFSVDVMFSLEDAVAFFKNSIMPRISPKTVAVGGSQTVVHSGIYDYLRQTDVEFINPYEAGITPEKANEARHKVLSADLFVASSNALIRDGRLLNLDGLGNRVAAITFGPSKVVLFIGRNKICDNLDEAITRVRDYAAPANSIRLKRNTPCVKTGTCMGCKSPERICNSWVLTERCGTPGRIHILLINEDVGY